MVAASHDSQCHQTWSCNRSPMATDIVTSQIARLSEATLSCCIIGFSDLKSGHESCVEIFIPLLPRLFVARRSDMSSRLDLSLSSIVGQCRMKLTMGLRVRAHALAMPRFSSTIVYMQPSTLDPTMINSHTRNGKWIKPTSYVYSIQ